MARILGIDPGLDGALALFTTAGELVVEDMPLLTTDRGGKSKRQADVRALADLIRSMQPSHAVIERVGAMPKQGVASSFAFGRIAGQIEGVVATLGIPVTYIRPLTWRRAFNVTPGKDGSRLRASELLPVCADRFRRKRDDGRAEAALMALWGFSNLPAPGTQIRQPIMAELTEVNRPG
jgi:crossover junction endodeoxyribonuclease RuvC